MTQLRLQLFERDQWLLLGSSLVESKSVLTLPQTLYKAATLERDDKTNY